MRMCICIIVQASPFSGALLQIIHKSKNFLPCIKNIYNRRDNDSQHDHWGFFHSNKKTFSFGEQNLRISSVYSNSDKIILISIYYVLTRSF